MTGDENAERIALLAEAAGVAWAELTLALRDLCPEREKHKFVQRRDHKRPWCPYCRYTEWGVKISDGRGSPDDRPGHPRGSPDGRSADR